MQGQAEITSQGTSQAAVECQLGGHIGVHGDRARTLLRTRDPAASELPAAAAASCLSPVREAQTASSSSGRHCTQALSTHWQNMQHMTQPMLQPCTSAKLHACHGCCIDPHTTAPRLDTQHCRPQVCSTGHTNNRGQCHHRQDINSTAPSSQYLATVTVMCWISPGGGESPDTQSEQYL